MLAMHSDVLSSVVSAVCLSTWISTIISARKHPPHSHTKQGEVWSYSYYIQLWILGHKQLLLQFNIKDFVLILECWTLNVKQWMIYDFEKIFAKNMYIEIYIFIIDNDNMNKE